MTHRHRSFLLASLVALPCLGAVPSAAERPSTTGSAPGASDAHKLCAARDLALVVLLEERGRTTASHTLDGAFRDVIRARSACARGDVSEALAIYEGAASKLVAD